MEKRKLRMPDIMESIFDVGYLGFDLIAAFIFFVNSNGRMLFVLYGFLTLILCGGDAFHLIPRVQKALFGLNDKIKKGLGMGLQVSSITMTIFDIVYLYIWQLTYNQTAPLWIVLLVWISAIARIVICLFPQNNWTGEGNPTLSMLRNGIFVVTGLGIVLLYGMAGNIQMVLAICISFGCYLPVTVLSKKKPMIGMLMIPKTCAYIWMIAMGLQLL